MLAWISAEAGAYATPLADGHRVTYLDPERSFIVKSRTNFFSIYQGLTVEVRSEKEARSRAEFANNCYLAYRLFLLLFDEEETDDDRNDTLIDLEQLVSESMVVLEAENRLCAQPMPESVNFSLVERCTAAFPTTKALLKRIQAWQSNIGRVRQAFNEIPDVVFSERASRQEVETVAIESGMFRTFVVAVDDPHKINLALLNAYRAMASVEGGREIVSAWSKNIAVKPDRILRLPELDDDWIEDLETKSLDGAASRAVYENVIRQQVAIIERLRDGDIDTAKRFAEDLIRDQKRSNSNLEYAAKTLCALSQQAKNLDLFELQLEWALQAQDLYPTDSRTHSSVADALIMLDRLNEAEVALTRTEEHGDPRYAAVGRARVLRNAGRYQEAYAAFKTAYAAFPDSQGFHALAGASASLREMGRLKESLEEYDEALKQYPGEQFLVTGKIATLTELGRWPEAIELANVLRKGSDPSSAILYADILRDSGCLQQAIPEYMEIVQRFPYYSTGLIGWADCLRLLGNYQAALNVLDEYGERFRNKGDILALRAELLGVLGRADTIIPLIENRRKKGPLELRITRALARLYRQAHRDQDALNLLDEAISIRPDAFWLKVERANQLGRLGYTKLAINAYDRLLEERTGLLPVLNAAASLHASLGDFEKATSLLPPIERPSTQDEWRSLILRGAFFSQQGRYREAIIHLNVLPQSVPFYRERRMLVSSIAMAELGLGRTEEAMKIVITSEADQKDNATRDVTNVISFHVLARSRRPEARRMLQENAGLSERLIYLKEEIAKRHELLSGRVEMTEAQILAAETNALMLEAA